MHNNQNRPNKKTKNRQTLIILIVGVALISLLGMGIYLSATKERIYTIYDLDQVEHKVTLSEMEKALSTDTFYEGIFINDIDVSNKSRKEVLDLFQTEKELDQPEVKIDLSFQEQIYSLTEKELTFESNLTTIVEEAYQIGRVSTGENLVEQIKERYTTWLNLKIQPQKLATSYLPNAEATTTVINQLFEDKSKSAVNAKANSFDVENKAFVIESEEKGLKIDIEKATKEVLNLLQTNQFQGSVFVFSEVVEPEVTKEFLENNLGFITSTTTETTSDANRNVNVRLIAQAIDGMVIQPGESWSFNSFIGKRTAEKGYKEAGGIYDGQLIKEVGGGICQTNTTLFHSLVKADLQIDQRLPHSWPMKYVNPGTDATVSWGWPDFSFTNNTAYPIAFRGYYENQNVTISVYGRKIEDDMEIKFVGNIVKEEPPQGPEYIARNDWEVGKKEQTRDPRNYILAESFKVYYKNNTEVKRVKAYTTTYNAIRAKIEIGVLGPNGEIYPLNPETGEVTLPETTPPPSSETTSAPPPSETPSPEVTTSQTTFPEELDPSV